MNRDRILATLRRAGESLRSFTLGQRVVAVACVLAVVVGGWLFYSWAATSTYSPLFTNLAAKDASAIVDELTASGTPYELADAGKTVMVPADQVYALRIKLSAAGLPAQTDTGYSLLDQQGVTTSEFMQQVGYQRAMEGELAKTIKAIDGVQAAAVHLAIPKKDVFSDTSAKPTAAVMVGTATGRTLTPDQVQAVVHLVASSVEGMSPDDVTVADGTGTVLAAPGQTGAGAGGGQAQQTAAYEKRLSAALQQLVTQVVGPNHAMVQVSADLDYDQSETTTQSYQSDPNTAPLSESTSDESYTGTGTGTGGVLGQTNGTTGVTGGNGTYQQRKTVRDNAVSSVVETRQSAPGKIRKLGVAVLLDQSVAGTVDLAQIRQLASSAVGVDTARGDTLAVNALPFDQTAAQQDQQALAESAAADKQDQLLSYAKTGAAALAVLLLLLGVWLGNRRRRGRARAAAADLRALDEIQAELERSRSAEPEQLTSGDSPGGELGPATGGGNGPDTERERKLREIEALVDDQPDEVARLLRGWLTTTGAPR